MIRIDTYAHRITCLTSVFRIFYFTNSLINQLSHRVQDSTVEPALAVTPTIKIFNFLLSVSIYHIT